MTRALVTGGAGFIGSHLVDLLLSSGKDVTVLDDLSTGRRANLAHLDESRYRFIEGSAADPMAVTQAMEDCTTVFHLAALADIVPSIVDPTAYFRANIDGTGTVVEAARNAGVSKLIYAASSSCYGIPDAYPTPESASIRPQYPYAFTKWVGEEIVRHWGQVYGLPYVSLRLFNVYGPRSRTSVARQGWHRSPTEHLSRPGRSSGAGGAVGSSTCRSGAAPRTLPGSFTPQSEKLSRCRGLR